MILPGIYLYSASAIKVFTKGCLESLKHVILNLFQNRIILIYNLNDNLKQVQVDEKHFLGQPFYF